MQHPALTARVEELWALHAASPCLLSAIAVARGECVLARLLEADAAMPLPSLFVVPGGGLRADWARGPWAVTVSFGRDGSVRGEAVNEQGRGRWERAFSGPALEDDVGPVLEWLGHLDALNRVMPQAADARGDCARSWRRALGASARAADETDELEAVL